uniref:Uncharacterized protein n=1 Tax=Oryza meridionalis TaxID=40149 RepID=A0A0E0DS00_9ORYZ
MAAVTVEAVWRLVTLSGGRSGASLLLGLCVGDVGVWVVVLFFLFPGYNPLPALSIELRTVSCESFKKKK